MRAGETLSALIVASVPSMPPAHAGTGFFKSLRMGAICRRWQSMCPFARDRSARRTGRLPYRGTQKSTPWPLCGTGLWSMFQLLSMTEHHSDDGGSRGVPRCEKKFGDVQPLNCDVERGVEVDGRRTGKYWQARLSAHAAERRAFSGGLNQFDAIAQGPTADLGEGPSTVAVLIEAFAEVRRRVSHSTASLCLEDLDVTRPEHSPEKVVEDDGALRGLGFGGRRDAPPSTR